MLAESGIPSCYSAWLLSEVEEGGGAHLSVFGLIDWPGVGAQPLQIASLYSPCTFYAQKIEKK